MIRRILHHIRMGIFMALRKDFFDLQITFPAIATNAKRFIQTAPGVSACVYRALDLTVGNSFTNTNVHMSKFPNLQIALLIITILINKSSETIHFLSYFKIFSCIVFATARQAAETIVIN